jgi:formylglycine-generating enzyme
MAFVSDRRTVLPHLVAIGLVFGLILDPYATVRKAAAAEPTRSCPPEMALVGESCVDRWEATLIELHKDGRETPWAPYYTPMGHVVKAVSVPGAVPQGHISMAIASNACRKSGKRLCRAKEWVAACRGPEKTTYPYGPVWIPGTCIDFGRTHALPKLHPGDEMYENRNMNDPRINQLDNTVAVTGSAVGCTNDFGVYDMVGNLNEWIDDKTMRGGFYLDVEQLGEGCDYVTKVHSNVYNDYSTGFRCCKDAELVVEPEPIATDVHRGVLDRFFDVSTEIEPLARFITSVAVRGKPPSPKTSG